MLESLRDDIEPSWVSDPIPLQNKWTMYISNKIYAAKKLLTGEYKIVLSVMSHSYHDSIEEYHHPDTIHIKIKVPDSMDVLHNKEHYKDLFEKTAVLLEGLMNKHPPGKLLVHCYAGLNRSISFAMFLLHRINKMNGQEAYTLLQTKRNNKIIKSNYATWQPFLHSLGVVFKDPEMERELEEVDEYVEQLKKEETHKDVKKENDVFMLSVNSWIVLLCVLAFLIFMYLR